MGQQRPAESFFSVRFRGVDFLSVGNLGGDVAFTHGCGEDLYAGNAFYQDANHAAGELEHLAHFHHGAQVVQVFRSGDVVLPVLLHDQDQVAIHFHGLADRSGGLGPANIYANRHLRIDNDVSHGC